MTEKFAAKPTRQWNAGEAACAQLIVGLKAQLDLTEPGETLEVVASSTGASIDIAVWCRMTGHLLLSADHPAYVIRHKAA